MLLEQDLARLPPDDVEMLEAFARLASLALHNAEREYEFVFRARHVDGYAGITEPSFVVEHAQPHGIAGDLDRKVTVAQVPRDARKGFGGGAADLGKVLLGGAHLLEGAFAGERGQRRP